MGNAGQQERRGAPLVRSGPAAGQSITLGDDLVIGREPGSGGAVLSDPSVSRRHAVVRKSQDGYVIYDLGSSNGTIVDGVKLSGRPLRNGDSIELGASVLQFGQA
jgi:pSer/pThr/pTyr-binding forkhead associated (FHA) protein